jgi:hypothetical protein
MENIDFNGLADLGGAARCGCDGHNCGEAKLLSFRILRDVMGK